MQSSNVGGLDSLNASQAIGRQTTALQGYPQPDTLNHGGNAALGITNQDLADSASHILIGEVKDIESRWNNNRTLIYTYITISVEEYLKGSSQGEEVVIRCLGGEAEGVGLVVSDEPNFVRGERVKVFLRLLETGEFVVVGGKQGKTPLNNNLMPASAGYSYKGIHWDSKDLPVKYYINELGTPDTTDEFIAVQQSFQTWEDDPGSYMDYTYMGTTNRTAPSKLLPIQDGYNVVSWGSVDGPGGTLAYTRYWYSNTTKLLMEFDIRFDEAETWSTTGEPEKYDIQNVCTHEVGHTLVLEDLYDPADSEETMYYAAFPGETKKRTLYTGDIAGIRAIYPVSVVPYTYTITTNPIGLQIEVDGATYTAPQSFNWETGSSHTLNAPSPQSGDTGTRYVWSSWSDGGEQSHAITVGISGMTVTANYVTQHHSTIMTSGLDPLHPATIRFVQLGIAKTANTSGAWSDWCDKNSTLSISKIVSVSASEQYYAMGDHSWTITSTISVTINYVHQYRVSIEFRTDDGVVALHPARIQILGGPPNNTLITVTAYSNIWMDDVLWTVTQIMWGGSNIVPSTPTHPSSRLKSDYTWTINCRVYKISFSHSFGDSRGVLLYQLPSSFELMFPNNTASRVLNPGLSYYIQNGTTTWNSIIWQGTEVVPEVRTSFDATDGNPIVNCRVYSLVLTWRNHDGTKTLYAAPSSITIRFPNGTTKTSATYALSQVQSGTISIASINWQGVDVSPSPKPSITLTTDSTLPINCLVYDISIKVTDLFGLPVSGATAAFTLPNGTTITMQTEGDGIATVPLVPKGPFRVVVSYMGQTTSISGDSAQAAVTPAQARIIFSLPVIVSIAIPVIIICALIFFRKKRRI